MGRLSTHVLDTAQGLPAIGLAIDLYFLAGETRQHLGTFMTNPDGRTDAPLLTGDDLVTGMFELEFYVGDYFRASGLNVSAPSFLERVPVRFGVADAGANYHVPLLVSPYGYSTYRGS